mmetsp:Transcript_43014/g.50316  ORF Transcript_43014/g.50316 Transcript_43014/m.50316 type:complete len:93 (+) Transcript_43014:60-338(+)
MFRVTLQLQREFVEELQRQEDRAKANAKTASKLVIQTHTQNPNRSLPVMESEPFGRRQRQKLKASSKSYQNEDEIALQKQNRREHPQRARRE